MQFTRHPTALFERGQLLGIRIQTSGGDRDPGVGSQHLDETLVFGGEDTVAGARKKEVAQYLAAMTNRHAEKFDQLRMMGGIPGEFRMPADVAGSNRLAVGDQRAEDPVDAW